MKKTFCGALLVALALVGCGGGGGSSSTGTNSSNQSSQGANNGAGGGGNPASTANNTVTVTVNGGKYSGGTYNVMNSPMVSVTLCQHNTSNCVTIPDILVDSGSSGLVLNAAAIPSSFNLPAETVQSDGNPIGACTEYGGGIAWGPMVTADVQMAGETAESVPVEIAGGSSSSFAAAPSACSDYGTLFSSSYSMGANGILGIAGDYNISYTGTNYYDCTSTTCGSSAIAPDSTQTLTGVIGKFASDNNGAILSFPAITGNGAASMTGTLTFGLNTQSNNQTANVPMVNGLSNSSMEAQYNNENMIAILDSGSSNEILSSAPMSTCIVSGYSVTWFCPSSDTTQNTSFVYQGSGGGTPLNVTFTVGNAQTLLTQSGSTTNYAIPNLAEEDELFSSQYLDLGMSFLYGHTLYIGYPLNGAPNPTIGLTTTGS